MIKVDWTKPVQIHLDNRWQDCKVIHIYDDGDAVILYEKDVLTFHPHSIQHIRNKPETNDGVDWTKPVQAQCAPDFVKWYDVEVVRVGKNGYAWLYVPHIDVEWGGGVFCRHNKDGDVRNTPPVSKTTKMTVYLKRCGDYMWAYGSNNQNDNILADSKRIVASTVVEFEENVFNKENK